MISIYGVWQRQDLTIVNTYHAMSLGVKSTPNMSECDKSTNLKKFYFYYNIDIMNMRHVRDTVYTFIDTGYATIVDFM